MKNTFKHGFNARNDLKILEVRAEFGWEGYAVFFALLEILCESGGYIQREALPGISRDLNLPNDTLKRCIELFIKTGLFAEDGKGIHSIDEVNNTISSNLGSLNLKPQKF